jgi:hypothetical protein
VAGGARVVEQDEKLEGGLRQSCMTWEEDDGVRLKRGHAIGGGSFCIANQGAGRQ